MFLFLSLGGLVLNNLNRKQLSTASVNTEIRGTSDLSIHILKLSNSLADFMN